MGTDIATRIVNRPLTRAEKVGSRDSIRAKASRHEDVAIKALAKLASGGRRVPATAQKAAAAELLDRIGGKAAKPEDEIRPEGEFDKMTEGQLLASICDSLWGLSSEARAVLAETLIAAEQGTRIDTAMMARDFDEEAAQRVKMELPPRVREAKPRKEPRR